VASRDISVEINVAGDVVDSEIVGIRFENGRQAQIRDTLFKRVFFEYLNLPTISEVLATLDRLVSVRKKGLREFDFTKSSSLLRLWMAILQDHYGFAEPHTFMLDMYGPNGQLAPRTEWAADESPLRAGDWVRLKNVHLSPFVNRSPGKFFLGGWRFHSGHSRQEDQQFAVSQRVWTWEDYAVRTMGIGDVRMGEIDDFFMLQASTAVGSATSSTDGGGAAISALGFPILVDRLIFNRLKPTIQDYGVVAVESIYAQVHQSDDKSGLIWAPGVPKLILVAMDRTGLGSTSLPREIYSSVWTVAAKGELSDFHYCTWGFVNGTKEHRKNLKSAVDVVKTAMQERDLQAVFEFDIEQNWFGDDTPFGPTQIKALAKKLSRESTFKRASQLYAIDAGAEHTVHDMLEGDERDLTAETQELLARTLSLVQLDRFSEALACIRKVLATSDNVAYAWYLNGIALYYNEQEQDAVRAWKKALDMSKNYRLRDRIEEVLKQVSKQSGRSDRAAQK